MAERPTLSAYALCEVDDVADLLGYDDDQTTLRQRTIIRAINSASSAIPRRAQREFVCTTAETDQTRFQLIADADVASGFANIRSGRIRLGDMRSEPTAVSIWSPDRDAEYPLDLDDDLYVLPDTPEPGFPYESIQIKASSPYQLVAGWWLSVTTDWGFAEVPGDIVEIAIGTAASQILNDVQALTERARQEGRRVSFSAILPPEYLEALDSYRLYRVA
jgi:hypothetical protein